MTRKKVKLAFITNDSARKATYKKRKRGLMKKMDELTTLCDVKACAILYSPYEARPVVWPGPSGAREVIASFKSLPEMEKAKKMVSQDEFLRQRVAKAHEQLKRQQKENRENDMTQVMYQCLSGKDIQNLSLLDLSDLGWVINQHLGDINKRIGALKKEISNSKIDNNVNNRNDNDGNNNNDINNKNKHKISKNNANYHLDAGLPPSQHVVGPESRCEGLQRRKREYHEIHDTMHMQEMVQPWSSYMNMLRSSVMHDDHHQQPHHGIGIGGGGGGGGGLGHGSSSGGAYDNMNMVMMSQFNW